MSQPLLVSTNPSRGYEVIGEVEASTEEEVAQVKVIAWEK